ncbi:MAG: hypothetical protein NZ518_09805, partial [Dehalococcoidia bacterium]|nr:hypothetical protein [Dehalococcoidia bacterium]
EVTASAVRARHLGAWSRVPPALYPVLTAIAFLRRVALLTAQGDAPYLVGQLRKRIATRLVATTR